MCEQAVTALQAPAGAFQAPTWPEDAPLFAPSTPTRAAPRKRLRLGSTDYEADQTAAEAVSQGNGAEKVAGSLNWRMHVRELQTVMDGGLKEALSGALLLLKKPVRRPSICFLIYQTGLGH